MNISKANFNNSVFIDLSNVEVPLLKKGSHIYEKVILTASKRLGVSFKCSVI